jgi:8-oxo-dGTP diphosphatase
MSPDGIYSVVGLLVMGDLVLAVSRRDDHDDLGLPGGKVEDGEEAEEALVRELGEEIGILADEFHRIYEHPDRTEGGSRRPCRAYAVTVWTGSPHPKEGQRVQWVAPSELLSQRCRFREYNASLFKAVDMEVVE